MEHNDRHAEQPYIIGRSVHNQRIERWWGFLRQNFGEFWIRLFKDMIELEVYSPHIAFQYMLLQFCFTELIREELLQVQCMWNKHRSRKIKNVTCPAGIPDVLFKSPALYGKRDMKMYLNRQILQQLQNLNTNARELNRYGLQ